VERHHSQDISSFAALSGLQGSSLAFLLPCSELQVLQSVAQSLYIRSFSLSTFHVIVLPCHSPLLSFSSFFGSTELILDLLVELFCGVVVQNCVLVILVAPSSPLQEYFMSFKSLLSFRDAL
jgi:hypothetical protein